MARSYERITMSILTTLLPFIDAIVDRIPDPKEAKKRKDELRKAAQAMEAELLKSQVELNKIEASHKSIFVAGWRPFIGWVLGSSLAYHFLVQRLLQVVLQAFGVEITLPDVEIGEIITLTIGMLGMGSLRTLDKIKNVDTKGMK